MPQETEKLKLNYHYILHVPVNRVELIDGLWYTNFLGSWESMGFPGDTKPWEVGDEIEITFRKVNRDRPTGTIETSSS